MTPELFEQLAQTWGADLRRWPQAQRAAAQALLARDAAAQAAWRRAGALDALLDAYAIAPPDARLQQAVLAGARDARPQRADAHDKPWSRLRLQWWVGAGLAGAGLAGTAIGALMVALALSATAPASRSSVLDGAWSPNVFESGTAAEWSEE